MASWRRKVTELFPAMRNDLRGREFTIYMVFRELLPLVREAHQNSDVEQLRQIYGFAEWCFDQKAKDLWNAAGVGFYEHLFDTHESHWHETVKWLSPQVIESCWNLWELQLSKRKLQEIQRLVGMCREPLYKTAHLVRRA